jgi:hypothetical protein
MSAAQTQSAKTETLYFRSGYLEASRYSGHDDVEDGPFSEHHATRQAQDRDIAKISRQKHGSGEHGSSVNA